MPDREGAQELKKNSSSKLQIVPIDVTDDWQVRGAVKYVKENLGDNGRSFRLLYIKPSKY